MDPTKSSAEVTATGDPDKGKANQHVTSLHVILMLRKHRFLNTAIFNNKRWGGAHVGLHITWFGR